MKNANLTADQALKIYREMMLRTESVEGSLATFVGKKTLEFVENFAEVNKYMNVGRDTAMTIVIAIIIALFGFIS